MHSSDPRFLVLHALRLRGVCPPDALAAAAGHDPGALAAELDHLQGEGLVKERTGRMAGWMLTREGRQRHAALLAADRDAGGLTGALRPAYTRFLEVNQPFIDLCSQWQVRPDTGEINDHTDAAYDAALVARLGEIHEVGAKVATDAAAVAERFAGYGPRLDHALAQVQAGERDWFTKPLIDSYHTVWFELHEDLLQSQGIPRTEGA